MEQGTHGRHRGPPEPGGDGRDLRQRHGRHPDPDVGRRRRGTPDRRRDHRAQPALERRFGGGGGGLGGVLGQLGGAGAVEPGGTADLSNNGDEVEFMGYVSTTRTPSGRTRSSARTSPTSRRRSSCSPPARAPAAVRPARRPGPFYCPPDQKVYLDLDFFTELRQRFGAPGDFAEAYVRRARGRAPRAAAVGDRGQVRDAEQQDPSRENELSVDLELQADCLAGVWAPVRLPGGRPRGRRHRRGPRAASAVGDDRIQASAGVAVNPETWTHGSAEQRSSWFKKGYSTGDPAACDTFAGG